MRNFGLTRRRLSRCSRTDCICKAFSIRSVEPVGQTARVLQKTKSMAFKGRDPVRTKIVIDNKIMEQVNSFNYLGNVISYEKELDIDNTLHNYLKITGILNNVFRPQKILKRT